MRIRYSVLLIIFSLSLAQANTVIWDAGGNGSTWEDPFNWSADALPTATDSVLISSGSVSLSSEQSIAFLNVSGSSTIFTIQVLGKLSITNSPGNAFRNETSFINYGQLHILDAGNAGLWNEGTNAIVTNQLSGIIEIKNTFNTGLNCLNKLKNYGDLLIRDTGNHAISNFENVDSLINYGQIQIRNSSERGISHSGTGSVFFNAPDALISIDTTANFGLLAISRFINEGKIDIAHTSNHGLSNAGNSAGFVNKDSINIHDVSSAALSNINVGSRFENEMNSVILIKNGLSNGLASERFFKNKGIIEVYNVAEAGVLNLNNADSLLNFGTINITKTGTVGFQNNASIAINAFEAEINIDSTESFGFQGNSRFENSGVLNITHSKDHALQNQANTDTLINNAIIYIDESAKRGVNNVGTGSVIQNNLTGLFTISNSKNANFYTEQKVVNIGDIELDWGLDHSLENVGNSAGFDNEGNITINHATLRGLSHTGANSKFTNKTTGVLTISNAEEVGLFTARRFVNEGEVKVEFALKKAWENNLVADSVLNSGIIKLDFNKENALEHLGGVFKNKLSGSLSILSPDKNGILCKNRFLNEGTLNINYADSVGIHNEDNAKGFLNSGIVNINYNGKDCIQNSGNGHSLFVNEASGQMTLISNTANAIRTSRAFRNYGSLNLNNSILNEYNADSLINDGYITSTNSNVIINQNGSIFLNETNGNIYSGNLGTGIKAESRFVNKGEIEFNEALGYGIENHNNSAGFLNNGLIKLHKPFQNAIYHHGTGSVFENGPDGQILIDSSSSGVIQIESKFINKGSITVTDLGNVTVAALNNIDNADSLINSGTFNIIGANIHAIANKNVTSVLHNSGTFDIQSPGNTGLVNEGQFVNTGDFTIQGSGATSFDNKSAFKNSGNVLIETSNSAGLWARGSSFVNQSSGIIKIDTTIGHGFIAEEKIDNAGDLFIANTNLSSFKNTNNSLGLWNTGTVKIGQSAALGLLSDGPTSLVKNQNGGIISIDSTISYGFRYEGTFENLGTLEIARTVAEALWPQVTDTLRNEGTFRFAKNHYLILNDSSIPGIVNAAGSVWKVDSTDGIGLIANVYFRNEGEVLIKNSNLFHDAGNDMLNKGLIKIANGQNDAFTNNGPLFNTSTGEISIDSSFSNGILNRQRLVNDGLIDVSGVYTALTNIGNPDSIINNAEIKIHRIRGIGLSNNITTNFRNNSTAVFTIDTTASYGINSDAGIVNFGTMHIANTTLAGVYQNFSPNGFMNYGTLNLSRNGTYGIENRGNIFENKSGGTIDIDQSATAAVLSRDKFYNKGSLTIRNAIGSGFHNSAQSDSLVNSGILKITNTLGTNALENNGTSTVLLNKTGGQIIIDTAANTAIFNLNRLVNQGAIEARNLTSGGIGNYDVLVNEKCGTIYNAASFFANSGSTFSNAGFFANDFGSIPTLNSAMPHTGIVGNYGLDINGTANFSNTGSETFAMKNPAAINTPYSGLVNHFTSPVYTYSTTWWAEKSKINAVGSYNTSSKIFTPNSFVIRTDTLYFEATHTASGCKMMVPIPIKTKIACNSVTSTATFTQAVSSDWHTAGNWSSNLVPDACTIVTIPTGLKCEVFDGRAEAHRILIETGAIFKTENAIVLEVDPLR